MPETSGENGAVILHEMPGCLVTRYPDSTVTKTGRRVTLDERSALELAARNRLPVPRVYSAEHGPVEGEFSIRMDFIHGDRLDLVWPSMNVEEKDNIFRQLRELLIIMRSIPTETMLIGSFSGGVVRDNRQYSDYCGGPYQDEATFNALFYFDLVETTPSPIRTALYQQLRSDHRIVFTHGDIAQHNILVKNGLITGLLDWENAGWYPEHWDYIKFFERPCKHMDWKDGAKEIFPQLYDQELAYHQAILRWQRP